jgi:MerR HTH family regulatory protein
MVIVCTHARPPCLRSMICKAYLPGSFQQDCLQTIVLSMTNHSEDEVPFPAPDPDRSKHQRASGPTLDENSITAMAGIGIGPIATEIGLTKDTLRVWERRYGFPRPLRTAGGERLYPQEQVTKLRMVKRNDFNPVCHPFRHHRTRRFAHGAYVIRGDMGGRRQPRAQTQAACRRDVRRGPGVCRRSRCSLAPGRHAMID